jgi:hypothetical protein
MISVYCPEVGRATTKLGLIDPLEEIFYLQMIDITRLCDPFYDQLLRDTGRRAAQTRAGFFMMKRGTV